MSEKRDYYDVLGINKNATEQEIKSAYRKMALKYHPDRNQGDKEAEQKFKEINEAYEILKDPEKKSMYDRFGHAGVGAGASSGFNGFNNGNGFGFDFNFGGDGEDIFSDIFNGFFGGNRKKTKSAQKRGSDLRYRLRVKLSEAVFGIEKDITFEHMTKCDKCQGTGKTSTSKVETCTYCKGEGKIRMSSGFFTHVETCHVCNGRGETITNPCPNCMGTGNMREKKKLKVNIPSGVDTGQTLRLKGEGNAGERGGEPGDLFVELEVVNDTKFLREETNLYMNTAISVTEAILGTEIKINTIDGKDAILTIPAGMQPQTTFRMREKGIPFLGSKKRGDLYVKVNINIPKKLNQDQKNKLIDFAKSLGEKVNIDKDKDEGFIKKIFK